MYVYIYIYIRKNLISRKTLEFHPAGEDFSENSGVSQKSELVKL